MIVLVSPCVALLAHSGLVTAVVSPTFAGESKFSSLPDGDTARPVHSTVSGCPVSTSGVTDIGSLPEGTGVSCEVSHGVSAELVSTSMVGMSVSSVGYMLPVWTPVEVVMGDS